MSSKRLNILRSENLFITEHKLWKFKQKPWTAPICKPYLTLLINISQSVAISITKCFRCYNEGQVKVHVRQVHKNVGFVLQSWMIYYKVRLVFYNESNITMWAMYYVQIINFYDFTFKAPSIMRTSGHFLLAETSK